MTTCIQNGTLVTGAETHPGDLLIENGIIQKVGVALSGDHNIDATGCLVFPGFIDGHTHMDMPVSGTVTADDFKTGSEAALVGGTTMLIDFATQDKGGTLKDALRVWHERADGKCACDYGFHMAVTDWNEQTRRELHEMADAGVTSFKAYYAYDALMVDDREMYDLLCEMREIGGILGVHCENGPVLDRLREKAVAAGHTSPAWHPRTRPSIVEGEAVSRFLRIADLAGAPAWIVHLSTADGLSEIRAARERGQQVLVESCPQYFTLTEEVYNKPDFEGAKYVCSPPLRPQSDQDALWQALETARSTFCPPTTAPSTSRDRRRWDETTSPRFPTVCPASSTVRLSCIPQQSRPDAFRSLRCARCWPRTRPRCSACGRARAVWTWARMPISSSMILRPILPSRRKISIITVIIPRLRDSARRARCATYF